MDELAALEGEPIVDEPPENEEAIDWEFMKKNIDGPSLFSGGTVQEFESELADFFDAKYVVTVSSGTSAIEICLLTLWKMNGEKPKVILPVRIYPSVMQVINKLELNFAVIDIDPSTTSINLEEFRKKANPEFDAVIVPQPYGITGQMNDILEVAEENDIEIIEDIGNSIGAEYGGKKAGTFGLGAIPLSPGKAVTAAEGGAVLTENKEYYQALRLVSHISMTIEDDVSVIESGSFDSLEQARKLDFGTIGTSSRISTFQAAFGLKELDEFRRNSSSRKEKYHHLKSKIDDIDGIELYNTKAVEKDANIESNHTCLFGLISDENIPRNLLLYCMMKENTPIKMRYKDILHYNIGQELLKEYNHKDFPESKFFSENNIFIRILPFYSTQYLSKLSKALDKCIQNLRNEKTKHRVKKKLKEERDINI